MKVSDSLKVLITDCHVINSELNIKNIQIEIWNKKIMKLKLDGRYTQFIKNIKDITVIEIKDSDEIYKDIEFLDFDFHYLKDGYKIYHNAEVFSIDHSLVQSIEYATGSIININGYEFKHNISLGAGSSGYPIILLNNNINSIQVIGIHKYGGDKSSVINNGTFIGEIINEINNNLLLKNTNDKFDINLMEYQKENLIKPKMENSAKESNTTIKNKDNYIIAEIYIKENNVNENIKIINSYENNEVLGFEESEERLSDNEEEIEECEIKINDELIPFNPYHKFIKKGKFFIKYTFKNYLTKTNNMFQDCTSLTSIDLSNFNTQYITSMNSMFYWCVSLTSINLFNINTQNITAMGYMFYGCSSLKSINLSNFNTENVINMGHMFYGCSSLTNIDLSKFSTQNVIFMDNMFACCESLTSVIMSNFNTQNVTQMSGVFFRCSSLKSINLSNFNTKNVTLMGNMFLGCSSLKNINLSNFDTQKVTSIQAMFRECSSLTSIDLSNFNTQNVETMNEMFRECSSLTSINLSNFNTQNVYNMTNLFFNCSSLANIDLSNFNTKNVKYIWKVCSQDVHL